MTTILKKGSSSDYITIKKQTAISNTEKNHNNNKNKKQFVTMLGNYNFIDTTSNCVKNAASYNLLNTLRKGKKNCCDIASNNALL